MIVHHQRLFADVVAQALEHAGFEGVTVATSLAELNEVVQRHPPDVAVIESSEASPVVLEGPLPTLFGTARTRLLAVEERADGALGVTLAPDLGGVTTFARGIDDLVADIIDVARGHIVVHHDDVPSTDPAPATVRRPLLGVARLTPRELEVLECLVDGADSDQVAQALSIRPNTVRTHVQGILMKLGVRTRLEAVAYAVRSGLVDPTRSRSAPDRLAS